MRAARWARRPPGSCPRPCPAHAACGRGRTRSRVLGVCPVAKAQWTAVDTTAPLGRCRHLAVLQRSCQGLCFKNKNKKSTQTVKTQSCTMTPAGGWGGDKRAPEQRIPPSFHTPTCKGSCVGGVGSGGSAEPSLGIPCLQAGPEGPKAALAAPSGVA